ncbi:alpha/beta hydrolase [Mangrovihabitans endophyticus]|uniref:alpha/beta hydrolase n=1 Tax=Mangrovihabitans endophyticus TaxID=1751298 RepID=UPI0016671CFD|nr:alpha/beta hydrolase [Mangrovihabitans endophyticus]
MTAVTYARLRVTDPQRWRDVAATWRRWADHAARWAAELTVCLRRVRRAWSSGTAAEAAGCRLDALRRHAELFRVLCWEADQAISEFAEALDRARALLSQALRHAAGCGLFVDDDGAVRLSPAADAVSASPEPLDWGTTTAVQDSARAAVARGAVARVTADITAAVRVAGDADATAAARLSALAGVAADRLAAGPADAPLPPCDAPAEVTRRWWDGLTVAQRHWLTVTRPTWIGSLDGVPASFRDLANRLSLPGLRAAEPRPQVRAALDALGDRLADPGRPRAYLIRLDAAAEGRAVIAVGDPDHTEHVLVHVPGMAAGLSSLGGDLGRAERVAAHAAQRSSATSAATVLWLDYDAPDFLPEAASAHPARDGAHRLRRFQAGLRAGHDGPSHVTVLGHSYGSLVVGRAASRPGLAADDLIFVGSPGVGADSVHELGVPAARVWSSTSRSDPIQHLAVSPGSLAADMAAGGVLPALAWSALVHPAEELWHGANPSDPEFGARRFVSPPDAGHSGYWDPGSPALDAITDIMLGKRDVTPR